MRYCGCVLYLLAWHCTTAQGCMIIQPSCVKFGQTLKRVSTLPLTPTITLSTDPRCWPRPCVNLLLRQAGNWQHSVTSRCTPSACQHVITHTFSLSTCHNAHLHSVNMSHHTPLAFKHVTMHTFSLSICHNAHRQPVNMSHRTPSHCQHVTMHIFSMSRCHNAYLQHVNMS